MECKRLAFFNEKGGCAKTTSIFHVAGILSSQGEKVLVIDFDKQCNATSALLKSEESEYVKNESLTFMDFMLNKHSISLYDVVKKNYIIGWGERNPKYRNIDVLPADTRFQFQDLLREVNIKSELDDFIKENNYTWVLVDMPPSNLTINEICFTQVANNVIVPFSSDEFSVDGFGDLMDTINRAREYNDIHILGIYLSRFMDTCAVDKFIREQLEEFRDLFIDVQIPLRADIREGVMFAKPINHYKKFSSSRTAYEKLVKEINVRI